MPIRILVLSLLLTSAATAAMIEPTPSDPWAALRMAPPPDATPDPSDYPVPSLSLELSQMLQFVLNWVYVDIADPAEYDAIIAALQPQYEAFLSSRTVVPAPTMSTPATSIGTMLSPLVLMEPLQLTVALDDDLSAVPEPRTWLLLVGGLALLLRRPLFGRG